MPNRKFTARSPLVQHRAEAALRRRVSGGVDRARDSKGQHESHEHGPSPFQTLFPEVRITDRVSAAGPRTGDPAAPTRRTYPISDRCGAAPPAANAGYAETPDAGDRCQCTSSGRTARLGPVEAELNLEESRARPRLSRQPRGHPGAPRWLGVRATLGRSTERRPARAY